VGVIWEKGRAVAAAGVALSLVVSVLVATPASAEPVVMGPKSSCVDVAADPPAAQAMARACNRRVEIAALRSERVRAFSNADGSTTMESSARPQRVRRPDGSWVGVDPSLRKAGDRWKPFASTSNATFAGGGSVPLVSVTSSSGHTFSLMWPSPLPAPLVAGDTATYANVLPDVDLVVRSTVTGFTHLLVVRSVAAARNPGVVRAAYQVGGDATVTVDAKGRLVATARDGTVVAAAPTSTMWDSSTEPVSARDAAALATSRGGGQVLSSAAGPGDRARRRNLAVSVENGELVVGADSSWLADPARRFPIYIDPSWDANNTDGGWAWAYANYDNYDNADGKAWVGQDPVNYTLYRSFFQFPTSSGGVSLTGKHILDAQLNITLWHSWSCSDSPVALWLTDGFSTPRTWFSPGFNRYLDTSYGHAHKPTEACGWQPDMPMSFAGGMNYAVQDAANGGWGAIDLGLTAADPDWNNEWNIDRWKKFLPETATLVVTYNSYPGAPNALTTNLPSGCRSTAGASDTASLPRVNANNAGAGLVLKAVANDVDGGTVQTQFEVWPKATKGVSGKVFGATTSPPAAVGTTFQQTVAYLNGGVPTLTEGTAYAWRANSFDGTDWSSWSPWCEFVVDNTPPDTPVASSADLALYPSPQIPTTTGPNAKVGRPATVTFKPHLGVNDPNIAGYIYGVGVNSSTSTQWVPADSNGVATVSITPLTADFGKVNSVSALAVDRAGNRSSLSGPTWGFKAAATGVGWWSTDGSGTSTIANRLTIAGTPGAQSLTLSGTASLGGGTATFTDGTAATASSALNTAQSFTVAAWVRVIDGTGYRGIASQDGAIKPAFQLQWQGGTGLWRFVLPAADAYNVSSVIVTSSQPGVVGTWAHVAGVYDSSAGQARLYVDGALAGSVSYAGPHWSSTGVFRIGKAQWDAALRDPMVGDIADVRVFKTALDAPGIAALATVPPAAGRWGMDDPAAGTAVDTSSLAATHNATVVGGAGWVPGRRGTAAVMDGSTGALVASGPVVDTSQSFTVSAWTYTDDASAWTYRTVVGQDAAITSGFYLQKTLDHWTLSKLPYDSTVDSTRAYSTSTVQAGVWTHLVGVYDAAAGRIKLYVNGVLNSDVACSCAWQATGPFTIGRAKWDGNPTDWWQGGIDDVRIFRGVLTQAQITYLYNN
jgi:hypothetical protein